MSDPDAIRADIERTRSELSGDVDALADKVTPSKIAHRQTDKVKGVFTSAKESVMGSVHDAKDSLASTASGAGDVSHQVTSKAKGNPLAVGLIAFGAGWLAASLIPASEPEKQAAAKVKDQAQPLLHEAGDAVKDVASKLKEPAQDAAQSLKETDTDAAQNVRDQATSAADDVRSTASDSASDLRSS